MNYNTYEYNQYQEVTKLSLYLCHALVLRHQILYSYICVVFNTTVWY